MVHSADGPLVYLTTCATNKMLLSSQLHAFQAACRKSSPHPAVILAQQPQLYWWGYPGSVGLVDMCMAHLSPGGQLVPEGQSQTSAIVSHHVSSSTVLWIAPLGLQLDARPASPGWLGCWNRSFACGVMRCRPLSCSNMLLCCINELASAYTSSHLLVNLSHVVRVRARALPVGASVAPPVTSSVLQLPPCLLDCLISSRHPCCCLCPGSLGCSQALCLMLPGHLVVTGAAVELKAIRSPAAKSGKGPGGLYGSGGPPQLWVLAGVGQPHVRQQK